MPLWRADGGMGAKVARAFSPRYLALGFIWAWMVGLWSVNSLAPLATGLAIRSASTWLPSAAFVVIGLFLMPLFTRNRPLSVSAIVLLTLVDTVGTGLTVALATSPFSWPVVLVGAMTGLGTAGLVIAAGGSLVRAGIEQIEGSLPACTLVSAILQFVISCLGFLPALVCVMVLPLASGALLIYDAYHAGEETAFLCGEGEANQEVPADGEDVAGAVSARRLIPTVILVAVMYATVCFSEACLPLDDILVFGPLVNFLSLLFAVVIVVLAVNNLARVDAFETARWFVPLLVCSHMVSLLGTGASATIALLGFEVTFTACSSLMAISFFARAVWGGMSGELASGLFAGSYQLGVLIGNLAARAVSEGGGQQRWYLVGTVVCVCLLVVTHAFLLPARRRIGTGGHAGGLPLRDAGASAVHPDAPLSPVEGPAGMLGEAQLGEVCRVISLRYGLTDRECEVLGYLVCGRSQPYIREALVLSKSTVSTHVKHIYAKMDIHSKQELISLAEGVAGVSPTCPGA